jgi:CBS domain-containing protein
MMTRTLIVPLAGPRQDPDGVSEAILPIARALSRESQAVVLVSVIELPVSPAETTGTIDERWGRELDAYLREVAATFDGPPVQVLVRHNTSVSIEVAQLCAAFHEPLVVMASEGRRGLRRALRGSVAIEVVQVVTCPVLIVPAAVAVDQPLAAGSLSDVLVPLDGSPLAEMGLVAGLRTLGDVDVHWQLLKVTDATGDEAALRTYLEGLTADLIAQGCRASWTLRHGKPAEQICAVARELGVQLIAMATRGRRGFDRLINGSMTEDVVRDAGVPVLVVRGSPEAIAAANERQAWRLGFPSVAAREARYRALHVRDIMTSPVATVVQATPLTDVARLMLKHRIGCVPVVDNNGKLAGIITESDFAGHREAVLFTTSAADRAALLPALEVAGALTASDVATWPVVTAEEDDPVSAVVELMVAHEIGHVPIVRNDLPVGVVSQHDLIRMVAETPGVRAGQDGTESGA